MFLYISASSVVAFCCTCAYIRTYTVRSSGILEDIIYLMAKIEFSFANGIFVNLLIEWSVAEQNHPVDKIIFWREINDKRFSSHSASEKDLHYGI